MALHLENTLSGARERFEPSEPDTVTLYYCGLTVSDRAHLGHARAWVHVDVLRRWLEHQGYDVDHVENFTDVNEKIVARVGERDAWTDEAAVAEHYIDATLDDMRRLNLKRPDAYPRVSEHVEEIIAMTERLIAGGHAYEADGSVYFDVTSFDAYGALSNQDLAALEASAEDHPEKRHPADFALWKAGGVDPEDVVEHQRPDGVDPERAVEGARTWDSPWGVGRPGWHIECSAMSTTHLGDSFDIHVAGRDIIFPHNENEIAQAEAATGQTYATYWVHVGLLETDDEKMSTSLGNYFTVEAAVDRWGANVVRTFLLAASHDTRQTFAEAAMAEAATRWERLERTHADLVGALDAPTASAKRSDATLRAAVADAEATATAALDDNLDTRGALVALESLAGAVADHLDGDEPDDYGGLLAALEVLETIGGDVLGLDFEAGAADATLEALLEELLAFREALRDAGEYDHADDLRARLRDAGVAIEDTDDGPRVRRVSAEN